MLALHGMHEGCVGREHDAIPGRPHAQAEVDIAKPAQVLSETAHLFEDPPAGHQARRADRRTVAGDDGASPVAEGRAGVPVQRRRGRAVHTDQQAEMLEAVVSIEEFPAHRANGGLLGVFQERRQPLVIDGIHAPIQEQQMIALGTGR